MKTVDDTGKYILLRKSGKRTTCVRKLWSNSSCRICNKALRTHVKPIYDTNLFTFSSRTNKNLHFLFVFKLINNLAYLCLILLLLTIQLNIFHFFSVFI